VRPKSIELAEVRRNQEQNLKWMRAAIRVSLSAMRQDLGGPFGAVVVRDGKLISRGGNQVISTNDPTAHAEIVAIRRACARLKTFELGDCELFTSCEPCPMCLSAIYWARIRAVYYANTRRDAAAIEFDDALIYREVARPLKRRILPMIQLLRNEAQPAFDEWRRKADKVRY
jgi:tRNA(Arg) A34 adenosine deaminase TadA